MSAAPPGSPLDAVRNRIIACSRCERLRTYCVRVGEEKRAAYRHDTYWARPVPGFGDPLARVLIIGLAPAAHGANRTGRVFTGDGIGGSCDFLMRAMHAAGFANLPTSHHVHDGLRLRDAYIAATVRCAPPDNRPSPTEIAACRLHLQAELAALPRVRVVVALGRIAFEAAWRVLDERGLGIRPRPPFAHRAVYPLAAGWTVIAAYHPSRQNTNTGRLTPPMLDAVFQQARRAAGGRSGD